jgi:hypothetical protein
MRWKNKIASKKIKVGATGIEPKPNALQEHPIVDLTG